MDHARLLMLRSQWSAPTDIDRLLRETVEAGFDGIEGPIPQLSAARREFASRLADAGLVFVAEATTGTRPGATDDWWVPAADASVQEHLDDLKWTVDHASEVGALFITTMCGYDAWPFEKSLDFFGRALEIERAAGIDIGFETHRTRSLFNPWVTRDLLAQLPAMRITCDFSHWCVVCERLIDSEIDIVRTVAAHALHVQCRVGHAQGAQIPEPRDPAWAHALTAHERWWDVVWDAQLARGMTRLTMTPEFGAEGYLQTLPFTGQPVADLWQVIRWMADRQRRRFIARSGNGVCEELPAST